MPRKPKSPCQYPGCRKLCDGVFCEEHLKVINRQYNRFQRDPASNKRYGSEWRKIRAAYIRQHPLCEECLKQGRLVPVEEVHHIVPLADGGTNDFSNLMSLCKSCHSAVTVSGNNKRPR